jgi:hypothetical protein
MRKRRLRWTWTVPALVVAAPALVLAIRHTIEAREATLPYTLLAWLGLAPLATAALMLRLDRRDRLNGGAQERAAADAAGPLTALRIARARAREQGAGPHTSDGVLLGLDHRGAPVRIPRPQAHTTIVGGSNSGKTNTAKVLLEAQVAAGGGFVVLDGKGGRDLPAAAVDLARRHHRRVALWSLAPFGDGSLDAHRRPWNACGEANATELKDRIAATEDQTEPYYRALASRGLLVAARALPSPRLDDLASLLEQPAKLLAALGGKEAGGQDAKWVGSLTDKEASALKGMGTRLRTMVASDGGEVLLPADDGDEIRMLDAIREGWLVVFTLPQGSYPELVPHVTRYVLQALNGVCARIEQSGTPADAVVFVDELSAFDGDQLCAGLERGRSAGVRYIVATQSLSNFAAAGGDKLLHAAIDNAELLVIHRQAVPDAAELLASVGGTEEAWEHTHKVSDAAGLRLGWDETGDRARRLTDRFRAHPNMIKQLGRGEAIVVSHRPAFAVRRLRIRLAD